MRGTLEDRYWAKVIQAGPDECWGWRGATANGGYGKLQRGPRSGGVVRAPVLAYEMAHGSIPAGLCVLHTCDNPPCTNPAHLFVGTKADNTVDMYAKGRGSPPPVHVGEEHPRATITVQDARDIRSLALAGWRQQDIADAWGTTRRVVSSIKRGETWREKVAS